MDLIPNAEGDLYRTRWAVICQDHGTQCLEEDNYLAQLSRPDSTWRCPICRQEAEWDDACPETNPADGGEDA